MPRLAFLLLCTVTALELESFSAESASTASLGLRVPPGFEVTEYADSQLANDIYSLTIDPRGRVVVSGRGYIRILVDDDGDGRADRAIDFAAGPADGAQGMLWEGTSLFVTGDGGLRRYRDDNGDDRADGPSELIRTLRTGGEHHAHDIKRGPGGWLYVLCGNSTGIDSSYATLPSSPIRQPVAGCVLRFPPDLKGSEIVADGFRNAYRMDFNPDGELFTFDSDNERCVCLPWYEGTRFYHVQAGGHHGWLSPQRAQWWRMPPYLPDVVPPVADLGRGSPTGVVCYRQVQFPERYRGGFFLLDWTFGKVYFLALQRSGSTYTCRKEVFLECAGDNGFAPTDAVVHPGTGDLFLSIGGRGTRGAVYRVRYAAGMKASSGKTTPLPQGTLSWCPGELPEVAGKLRSPDARDRLAALVHAARFRSQLEDPFVLEGIRANWDHPDRQVRRATSELVASLTGGQCERLLSQAATPRQSATCLLALARKEPLPAIRSAARLLEGQKLSPGDLLELVRVFQLALDAGAPDDLSGTIWEGYALRKPPADPAREEAERPLWRRFPTGEQDADREITRTLAMLESAAPEGPRKVLNRINADSPPVEDIHYLTVLARLRGARPADLTDRVASALLALDRKIRQLRFNRDRHWPLRISELYAELFRKDPRLHEAMLASPEFGRPDHGLFALAPGFDRRRAAEVFLARAARDPAYEWSPSVVELLGSLPIERSGPLLRHLWDRGGLEDAVRSLLAQEPQPADRDKFLEGLRSPQLATIRLSLAALEKLPARAEASDLLALVRALRSLGDSKEEKQLQGRLAQYLRQLTGQKHLGDDREAWTRWLLQAHPDLARGFAATDGVDVLAWNRRLAGVDWSTGDVERGRQTYARASCANCHSGGQALGPDLHGVARRFSRDDLFTAILQPSRDISPRYRTTLIETADGQVYQGMIIYEAVDSVILQTGPAATVRLAHKQIAGRRTTETSLMPAGLLDKLADRDLADLYAYLKSLSP
jgi:putative membrane-bound dehydrogenase-like protein